MMRRLVAAAITAYVALVIVACIASRFLEVLPTWAQVTTVVLMLSAILVAAVKLLQSVYEGAMR